MKKNNRKRYISGCAVKCAAATVIAVTMSAQPCFASALSDYNREGFGYSYGNYTYWEDEIYDIDSSTGNKRKITDVTKNYDDGTQYISNFKYDEQGNLLYAALEDPSGYSFTISRTYNEGGLVSEESHEYEPHNERTTTKTTDYTPDGYPNHAIIKYESKNKASFSKEVWINENRQEMRIVEADGEKITAQRETAYNEAGEPLVYNAVNADGSTSRSENLYDDNGRVYFSMGESFDAATQIKTNYQTKLEGDPETGTFYYVEIVTYGDGSQKMEENWSRAEDSFPVRSVYTGTDGKQVTEEYTYNEEGNETLYVKTGADGVIARRETNYDRDGAVMTYNSEYTEKNSDGSSSYKKQSRDSATGIFYFLLEDTTAEGVKTYTEYTTASDGSKITKEKDLAGTVTVTKTNDRGEAVSITETLADGTTSETIWEEDENGQIRSLTKQYSDGTQDRIDYEYDDGDNLIKKTETRKNGVQAVTETKYSNEEVESRNMTFNNGCQMTIAAVSLDEGNGSQETAIYSLGDVAREMTIFDGDKLFLQTVYRDGRTEEHTAEYDENKGYTDLDALQDIADSHYDAFLELAWAAAPAEHAQ